MEQLENGMPLRGCSITKGGWKQRQGDWEKQLDDDDNKKGDNNNNNTFLGACTCAVTTHQDAAILR